MSSMRARVSDFEQRTYTVSEFEKMAESYERFELLDGKLVEKPVPRVEHSLIAEIIKDDFKVLNLQKNVGLMLPEVSVYIRSDYSPAPDLSFWKAERAPSRKVLIAPRPDLAVEIQSPGQSLISLKKKAQEYLKGGVLLVWIVQPEKQLVLVYRQGQAALETVQLEGELSGEDVIPDFKLPVRKLFED